MAPGSTVSGSSSREGCLDVSRTLLTVTAALVAAAGAVYGYDDRAYYPYAAPYRYYAYPHRPHGDVELSRLRRDLRSQRMLETEQLRRQEKELELLRQQSFIDQQVTARQACYYRSTGGFELCGDLFENETQEFAACEALVVRRNPGCNELPLDAAR
jgi:hypothetical protein